MYLDIYDLIYRRNPSSSLKYNSCIQFISHDEEEE